MFMGPFDQAIAWSTDNIVGVRRFIEKVWRLQEKMKDIESSMVLDSTIKKVGEDIEEMKFNTAISALMILTNEMEKKEEVSKQDYKTLLILLAPFAPHVTEELWNKLGNETSVLKEEWPKYDESKIIEDKAKVAIQINGKVRAAIDVLVDEDEEKVKERAISDEIVQKWIEGKDIKKVMYIKGKIVSIVIV
jgi:leucyl-tRNA synthetase